MFYRSCVSSCLNESKVKNVFEHNGGKISKLLMICKTAGHSCPTKYKIQKYQQPHCILKKMSWWRQTLKHFGSSVHSLQLVVQLAF